MCIHATLLQPSCCLLQASSKLQQRIWLRKRQGLLLDQVQATESSFAGQALQAHALAMLCPSIELRPAMATVWTRPDQTRLYVLRSHGSPGHLTCLTVHSSSRDALPQILSMMRHACTSYAAHWFRSGHLVLCRQNRTSWDYAKRVRPVYQCVSAAALPALPCQCQEAGPPLPAASIASAPQRIATAC